MYMRQGNRDTIVIAPSRTYIWGHGEVRDLLARRNLYGRRAHRRTIVNEFGHMHDILPSFGLSDAGDSEGDE